MILVKKKKKKVTEHVVKIFSLEANEDMESNM